MNQNDRNDDGKAEGNATEGDVTDGDATGGHATRSVLICEDEPIIAMDLQMLVEDLGFTVIGPCSTMSEARGLVADMQPDVAILDVNLSDGEVFPLADDLLSAGTRLIFHSGHCQASDISARFPGAELSEKPYRTSVLKKQILQLGGAAARFGAT